MARSNVRRRKAKPKPHSSAMGLPVKRLAAVALILAALFFLRDPIGEALMKAFGVGIIVVIVWIGIVIFIVRQREWQSVWRNWNYWLGALLLSATLMGIVALFRPHISLAGAEMDKQTLAGASGMFIRGTSYEWAHLLGLTLLGAACILPAHSLTFAKGAGSLIWQLGHNGLLMLSLGAWQLFGKLRAGAISLTGRIHDQFSRRRATESTAPSMPAKAKAAVESATPATFQDARILPETYEDDSGDQMPLPMIVEGVHRSAGIVAMPPIDILDESPKSSFAQANNTDRARLIEEALASYGVEVKVQQINPGPSVTQFGVEPGWVRKYKRVIERDPNGKPKLDKDGNTKYREEEVSKTRVKVEKITSLSNDLALALAVPDIRIEAPMPGKALVGIEVPNVSTAIVSLRSVIESAAFQKTAAKSKLAIALGQGAGGEAVAGDMAKMPHLLIAGATGSGKSVCLNCIVSCLLAQTSPADVRLLLIDPKRVEMTTFSDVPHLITPVVIDSEQAVDALRRLTTEMDIRYRKFASVGVRNIDGYNLSPRVNEQMPYIVAVVDELADMMMTSPDVVEPLICRLAQLARATGIHLIVATQRPSVDVITGLIKANFPTRISFAVVSAIDSRTILDTVGAEKLLGRGDMLYIPPEASKPKRIRGCFVSDEEMIRLVNFWKEWATEHFPPDTDRVAGEFAALPVERLDADPLMEKARQICRETARVSASLLQRRLHVGYQRASRILEQLEEEGLLDSEEFEEDLWEGE